MMALQDNTSGGEWTLRLFIAGRTPKSVKALANLKRICEDHLANRYVIEVVDVMATPEIARQEQIVVIPTLVRRLPPPLKRIIGDLSNSDKVLVGLELDTCDG